MCGIFQVTLKSSTHLLVINLAWPNICVHILYLYTYAGDDHFPQQVVARASPGQHDPMVTPQGVLPHPFQGTLSFTI